ncbi:hypothetical protein [Streptomyces roseochromogenus]|uniref:Uncharacterized protein n=1 Tax=Streptomyces roseochromogenus subsp. oscitans DS 12.976 TaxID=1352936 RepID=V6K7C8_STRRC|nr:hypothetical protein [Streptomyces roseochromogenus]EST28042.1 hypothetical protein M878_23505 [Streptomyces roseochromogenus subsp. oscitans DS 12.976]
MGELVFDRAHQILRERGQRKPDEETVAQVAEALLDRAGDGPDLGSGRRPADKSRSARRRDRKVAARTRATSEPAWPRSAPESQQEPESVSADEEDGGELADVVPLEIFDARKEAEKWW